MASFFCEIQIKTKAKHYLRKNKNPTQQERNIAIQLQCKRNIILIK